VCECELDVAGVAQHGNQQAQSAARFEAIGIDWSRKRVLAREMCLSAENTRNAVLARQTQEKERIPRNKALFMDVITESHNSRCSVSKHHAKRSKWE
jgi:hypothetical protein